MAFKLESETGQSLIALLSTAFIFYKGMVKAGTCYVCDTSTNLDCLDQFNTTSMEPQKCSDDHDGHCFKQKITTIMGGITTSRGKQHKSLCQPSFLNRLANCWNILVKYEAYCFQSDIGEKLNMGEYVAHNMSTNQKITTNKRLWTAFWQLSSKSILVFD